MNWWKKYLIDISKDHMQVVKSYVKKYPTSLILREVQIIITIIRCHLTPVSRLLSKT